MSELLDFAVIGTGRFARHYIKTLQDFYGVNLTAVCGRSKDGLRSIKEMVSEDILLTTSISDALKKADCAVIATPPTTHFEIAKAAIFAKKHVLLEKPMTSNLMDANKLVNFMKKSRSTFMVGHQYVYNDHIKYLKDQLSSLGKIELVHAEHMYPGPMRDDIGCLWDAGTHKLSIIQYLSNPGDIKYAFGHSFDILGNNLDDFTSCNIEFKNKLKASISVSWMSPVRSRRLILFGKEKTAVFDDISEQKLKIYDVMPKKSQNRSIYAGSLDKISSLDYFAPKIKANDAIKNQLNHFISCIRGKKEPLTGAKSSYEITKWLDFISTKIRLPGY